ncbi:MAG: hypothetical protein EOO09_20315 [Chitinophagaceae bacterium]|nr:MAG: hypothetical protein EOO09_20315 [Chitinophagaceae bacterium]
MQLIEVSTPALAKDFLKVNILVNRNDPNYIRPLDKDVNEVFDKKKNKTYRQGEAIRWILKDDQGNLIGRIAAFTNKKYKNKGDTGPVGGMGFFDCINSQEAADKLFDTAKAWLLAKGMTAMDGPINFGERDRWWGLVVEGFHPPLYAMNYNQPYYQALLENYGFRGYFDQLCFAMKVGQRMQEKFYRRHAACAADPALRAEHMRKSDLPKYARDFATVYNRAWAGHGGMKKIEEKVVIKMFETMKPVMDERINWFVYHNDEPVGAWINLPDLNQWFKHLNGDFGLLSKLKFLWVKKTKKADKMVGLVFGIVPEWQGKGLDSYMIVEGARVIQDLSIKDGVYTLGNPEYQDYEMQWIGAFNPKMVNVAENLGTYRNRVLTTYRYQFDREAEFKPHPILH